MGYKVDRELFERVRALDENELRKIVKSLARSAGMGEVAANFLAGNSRKFKQKLASMNEDDLTRILAAVPAEAVEKLARSLK